MPVFLQQVQCSLFLCHFIISVLLCQLYLFLVVLDGIVLSLAGLRFFELFMELIYLLVLVLKLTLELLNLFLEGADLAIKNVI